MTSYELEIRETERGAVAVAEIAGELDLTNVEELERSLDVLAATSANLVLDLNRTQFLDSAALHVLFGLSQRLRREGKELGIVLARDAPVAKTLEIVSFEQASTVRPSLEEVLVALGA